MSVVPLSRWLAAQTADLHRDVEADLLPAGRVVGFGDAIRLVAVHDRVLARYAEQVDAVVPVPGAPLSRWRAAARADLVAWGADERALTTVGAPSSQPTANRPELVGVRYVLEGARVGLRVLAEQIQDSVRAAGAPPSMLFVTEPDAGDRWHRIRAWLDGPDNEGSDRRAVLSGAREAFGAYRSATGGVTQAAAGEPCSALPASH